MTQMVKHLSAKRETGGSISGLERSPGEGNGYPLQYCLTGEFHGQRGHGGLQLIGCKKSDQTQLSLTNNIFYKIGM